MIIELVPSVFTGKNKEGDFSWMIVRSEYEDALFVFNDNQYEFLAQSERAGKGNAIIRPYQHEDPPRCTGIPTGIFTHGVNQGYTALYDGVASIIDKSVERIRDLLATHRYKRVIYSSDGNGGLGTGCFQVANDVKEYIITKLQQVVQEYNLKYRSLNATTTRIYTDGSCLKNPGGPGGWACLLIENDDEWSLVGSEESTTNNRMELRAVIEALSLVGKNQNTVCEIYTDSQWVLKCATGEWKRKANLDMWGEYDEAAQGLELKWNWVRGHSGNKYNEIVDKLAREEAKEVEKEVTKTLRK